MFSLKTEILFGARITTWTKSLLISHEISWPQIINENLCERFFYLVYFKFKNTNQVKLNLIDLLTWKFSQHKEVEIKAINTTRKLIFLIMQFKSTGNWKINLEIAIKKSKAKLTLTLLEKLRRRSKKTSFLEWMCSTLKLRKIGTD